MKQKGGFPGRSRAVYRSNNNANANGGVSYANTSNDSANVNANIGSRLANNHEWKKGMDIGVWHRGRVPTAEPTGMSLGNSAGKTRKAGRQISGQGLVGRKQPKKPGPKD